jgi:hypothetical protein
MKPSTKGSSLLGWIDVDIGVGSSCHRQFAIFVLIVVPPSCVPYEFEISTRSQNN